MTRNAIKRRANRIRACRWSADDRGCGRCSECEGIRDAVRYAARCYRRGERMEIYPDAPDYFGNRLSDSVTGSRYVAAFDDAINSILGLFR